MNKKLIEVLEMIAQGEQIRFICDGCEYHTDKEGRILNEYNQYVEWCIYKDWLNEEAEIIEEKKKNPKRIENISDKELEQCDCDYDRICLILDRLDEVIEVINERNI